MREKTFFPSFLAGGGGGKRHVNVWRWKLTAVVVVNVGLGKHSVVLDLRLAQGRAVIADDDELALPRPEGLERALVPQGVLARLHDESKARVDGLGRLLDLLLGRHGAV